MTEPSRHGMGNAPGPADGPERAPDPSDVFDPRAHRKRVRRYDEPGYAHEPTFSCYRRLPLLNEARRCLLLSRAIDDAMKVRGFELVAFVHMPEHVHLIVWPVEPKAEVSDLLWAIKRPFSFRAKQLLTRAGDPLVKKLMVRERPGVVVFRFWQEGGGYDRNIRSESVLRTAIEHLHHNPVRRRLCDSPYLFTV